METLISSGLKEKKKTSSIQIIPQKRGHHLKDLERENEVETLD